MTQKLEQGTVLDTFASEPETEELQAKLVPTGGINDLPELAIEEIEELEPKLASAAGIGTFAV